MAITHGYFTEGTPTSGTIQVSHVKTSPVDITTTIKMNAARVPITDATSSGSYGTLKLGTFAEGFILHNGGIQDYTAFAEGSALTTAAGDAAFVIGCGTSAISAAADGALATANQDIISSLSLTLASGTITGRGGKGGGGSANGTTTAATLNLNVSGSAATIDATSYLDVTGTIIVRWGLLADFAG
jgi:hypothetical protein